jgi:hypothetical protein
LISFTPSTSTALLELLTGKYNENSSKQQNVKAINRMKTDRATSIRNFGITKMSFISYTLHSFTPADPSVPTGQGVQSILDMMLQTKIS